MTISLKIVSQYKRHQTKTYKEIFKKHLMQEQLQMELLLDLVSLPTDHQYVLIEQVLRLNYSANCLKAFK